MNRSIVSLLGLGTLMVMQLGGSCATDVSYHEHDARPVYVEPPPPPVREEVRVYHDAPPPPAVPLA